MASQVAWQVLARAVSFVLTYKAQPPASTNTWLPDTRAVLTLTGVGPRDLTQFTAPAPGPADRPGDVFVVTERDGLLVETVALGLAVGLVDFVELAVGLLGLVSVLIVLSVAAALTTTAVEPDAT